MRVDFSVLYENVTVEKDATVMYSLIMPGAVIKKGAVVKYAVVAENTVIEEGAVVGESPENMEDMSIWGVSVVGSGITVGKEAVVSAGTMVREDVKAGEKV